LSIDLLSLEDFVKIVVFTCGVEALQQRSKKTNEDMIKLEKKWDNV